VGESATAEGPSVSVKASAQPKRSRLRTWGLWSVALVITITGFSIGRVSSGIHALPSLAATLPGDESEFNHEIDQRIKELFPILTDDKKLIAYLSAQGFTPEWREKDYANAASFIWTGVLCTKVVRVVWRADSEGAVTQVNASYQTRCVF
jgi:hypothetical protein